MSSRGQCSASDLNPPSSIAIPSVVELSFYYLGKNYVPLAKDHMLSPLCGKKQPVPSNLFQFICMDHHCIIYSKPHCNLLSAQTTYLIAVFGGLLERTIFDLLLCMAHISTCIGANLKNYMRSRKHFSRATI